MKIETELQMLCKESYCDRAFAKLHADGAFEGVVVQEIVFFLLGSRGRASTCRLCLGGRGNDIERLVPGIGKIKWPLATKLHRNAYLVFQVHPEWLS